MKAVLLLLGLVWISAASGSPVPGVGAASPHLLLYPVETTLSSVPSELIRSLPRRLAAALREGAQVSVTVAEGPPATEAGGRERDRTARVAGATHWMRGRISGYSAPAGRRSGKAVIELAVSALGERKSRELRVEAAVPAGAKPERMADEIARAVSQAFRRDLLPTLAGEAAGGDGVARLVRRGRDAMEIGGLDEAQRDLMEALRRAPRDAAVNAAVGDLFVRLGQTARGIDHYRRSLLFSPAETDVRRRLVRALDAHGMPEELAAEARRMVSDGVADAEVWRRLGHACRALGLAAEAEAAYEKSFGLEADAETLRASAFLWMATGRAGRAAALLEPRAQPGGEREFVDLHREARALPPDAFAAARERLPEPDPADPTSLRSARARLAAEARTLITPAVGHRWPTGGRRETGASVERRRQTIARSAAAHGLVALASAWKVAEADRAAQEAFVSALKAVARAALAHAAAEERPWAGGGALVGRLTQDAEEALALADPRSEK